MKLFSMNIFTKNLQINFICLIVFLSVCSSVTAQQITVSNCADVSSKIANLIPTSNRFTVNKCEEDISDHPHLTGSKAILAIIKYSAPYTNTDLHYLDETLLQWRQLFNQKVGNRLLSPEFCTMVGLGQTTCYPIGYTETSNNPLSRYKFYFRPLDNHYELEIFVTFRSIVTPTPTPTSTPTEEPCLNDEEVNNKVDEILSRDGSVCQDGVLEQRSTEVTAVFKKACNKKDPYLPRGLDYMTRKVGDLPYAAWPLCHDHLYKAILASGYPLIGNPSQRLDDGTSFLKDNGWNCYSVEKESHPYRWGRGSQNEEVVVGVPKNNTRPDLLLGVTRAIDFSDDYNPRDYPERIKIKKGKKIITLITGIDYKKQSSVSLFSALKNSSPIPKVGKMNNDYYTQILKQIPRGSVNFKAFGVIKKLSGIITAGDIRIFLRKDYKQALACVPPKKTVVKDDDEECGPYSIEESCTDALADEFGIKLGNKDYGAVKRLTKEQRKRFINVAAASLAMAGGGSGVTRDADLANGVAIAGAESMYNFRIINNSGINKYEQWNGRGRDWSLGYFQRNLLSCKKNNGPCKRNEGLIARLKKDHGGVKALYVPKINGQFAYELFRSRKGWSAWSVYTRPPHKYTLFLKDAKQHVKQYRAYCKENNTSKDCPKEWKK